MDSMIVVKMSLNPRQNNGRFNDPDVEFTVADWMLFYDVLNWLE